jgi:hypothetical protein
MSNPFGKSRDIAKPYAIYICGDFTWHVLKTYKLAKNEDAYSRWFVAAKSDATFGSFELGDTYAQDVERFGVLVAADPAWLEAYGITKPYLPTPAEYLEQTADA